MKLYRTKSVAATPAEHEMAMTFSHKNKQSYSEFMRNLVWAYARQHDPQMTIDVEYAMKCQQLKAMLESPPDKA